MKSNRWQRNFNRALVYDLYVKPILAAVLTWVVVVVVLKWLLKDLLNPEMAILAVLLYYLFFIDAKIDLLKRTLDEKARYRDTKKLWIEGELE